MLVAQINDVDGDRPRVAHAGDGAVLDDAQQLGLLGKRDVADFVQEERGAVGLLEFADVVGMGVGEGTFHMTEHLTLEQRLSDSPNIDAHHRFG